MGATAALTTIARDGATRLDPLVDMIKRAASGHESAFAEFYSATSARVYGLVNRVCVTRHYRLRSLRTSSWNCGRRRTATTRGWGP